MENKEQLIKSANIQEIADKGGKIYEEIKHKFKPEFNDKFLAIDVESGKIYMGDSTVEAVEKARFVYSDEIFYVVKIGSSASEILDRLRSEKIIL